MSQKGALPRETTGEIAARLELERDRIAGRAILAFDGDGTLWSGDIGVEVFIALLEAGGVRDAARPGLIEEARLLGLAADGSAVDIARALHAVWEGERRLPDDRAYAMHAWGFAGWSAPELERFVDDVLSAGGIDARIRRDLEPIMTWAAEARVDVYIVSASPESAVERAARTLGIGPERIVAMAPEWQGGVVAPRLRTPPVFAEGKVPAIERAAPDAVLLGAFGDSGFDAPFLRRARIPVAVDPNPALVEAAPSIPGLVALAP